jgi:hypothetical protein
LASLTWLRVLRIYVTNSNLNCARSAPSTERLEGENSDRI